MKAYENSEFIHSPDGRIVRILCEYLETKQRLKRAGIEDTVVFFGSARSHSKENAEKTIAECENEIKNGNKTDEVVDKLDRARCSIKMCKYYEDASELSAKLTNWSKALPHKGKRFIVCSGGGPGMMEAANRGASEQSGLSVGFNISLPNIKEPANSYITDGLSFEFHYFFMRKYWFAYLAKALVILPGGFGTLDELMEVLTLMQTQKMVKEIPIVIYGREYWNDVLKFENLVKWGTISPKDLKLFRFCDTPDEAFDYLTSELTRLHLNGK